jgi:hypothetical protein
MSERGDEHLGKVLALRTAQGGFQAIGKCIAYCEVPTVTVETVDGKQIYWRADLSKVVELSQDEIAGLFPPEPF